jgi:hypothetical protein
MEHPLNMSVALMLELAPFCSYCLLCVHNLFKLKSLFWNHELVFQFLLALSPKFEQNKTYVVRRKM